MSLDPLHEHIARVVFGLPEAHRVAIAGGGAMLALELVDRPTHDLDLFTPDEAEVVPLADALAQALRAEGATVEVDRRGRAFTHLAVTMPAGPSVAVELGQDARIRQVVKLSFGRVLDPEELAADKTLALFGRAAARDLVDVVALTKRYPLEQLCSLAIEKDRGFDRRVLADALGAAANLPDAAFTELGLSAVAMREVRAQAGRWQELLRTG